MRFLVTLSSATLLFVAGCGGADLDESVSSSEINPNNFSADLAIQWNQHVNDVAFAEDQFFTLKGSRAHAMMHIAMHDALNSIERKYEQYAYTNHNNFNANPVAAAAQAAYDVVVNQYPGDQASAQALLNTWLATVPNGSSKNAGINVGHASASAILAERTGDNFDAAGSYTFQTPAPGVYQSYPPFDSSNPPFVFGAGWGLATPFTMNTASQFRPSGPPSVNSFSYAVAYNETKSVGQQNSVTRTADQSHAALWWREFTEGSMNRLGRQLAASQNLNLWKASRMFAQVNMNMFDGYVSNFESKFFINFWRPVTGIHQGSSDGNINTIGDPNWVNMTDFTPPFPSYPSAHGTVCSACLRVFGKTFGNNFAFTMTTNGAPPDQPQTRSFSSFTQAADECGASRVYLGFHWRFDSTTGVNVGRTITDNAWSHELELH